MSIGSVLRFQYPEDQPEFPVIERKYFVQFMFLEDTSTRMDGLHLHDGDFLDMERDISLMPTERTEGQETDAAVCTTSSLTF